LTDRVEPTILKTAKEEKVQVKLPPGIDHYYVMEMLDQPNAVCKALNYGARLGNGGGVKLGGLDSHEEELFGIENLIIAACGTSFLAG
jgi:glucosamine--fructose-6-phosphate aminotransferase (isomerizing)